MRAPVFPSLDDIYCILRERMIKKNLFLLLLTRRGNDAHEKAYNSERDELCAAVAAAHGTFGRQETQRIRRYHWTSSSRTYWMIECVSAKSRRCPMGRGSPWKAPHLPSWGRLAPSINLPAKQEIQHLQSTANRLDVLRYLRKKSGDHFSNRIVDSFWRPNSASWAWSLPKSSQRRKRELLKRSRQLKDLLPYRLRHCVAASRSQRTHSCTNSLRENKAIFLFKSSILIPRFCQFHQMSGKMMSALLVSSGLRNGFMSPTTWQSIQYSWWPTTMTGSLSPSNNASICLQVSRNNAAKTTTYAVAHYSQLRQMARHPPLLDPNRIEK